MIEAEVRGKAAEISGSEDCLTSAVFGLLKYSPMRPALRRFIGSARLYADPERRLSSLLPPLQTPDDGTLRFWERHGGYGEPDLMLIGDELAIAIEVKYRSGISGVEQLRNYRGLLDAHYRDRAQRHVVYLTADLTRPELPSEAVMGLDDALWWLSWHELSEVLGQGHPVEAKISADLRRLLSHRGLGAFNGFSTASRTSPSLHFWDDITPLITPRVGAASSLPHFWRGGTGT